jgi:uncharacterized protein YfaT (DUF1175 family)
MAFKAPGLASWLGARFRVDLRQAASETCSLLALVAARPKLAVGRSEVEADWLLHIRRHRLRPGNSPKSDS